MARRKTRTRRRKSFKLLNALESLTYAEILSRGVAGTGIAGFIGGQGDIASTYDTAGAMTGYSGTGSISLTDIVQNPGVSTSMQTLLGRHNRQGLLQHNHFRTRSLWLAA